MELKVKGHSGCVIDIANEGNNLRIHKWSKDPKYLARLAKQAEKQQEAYKDEYQHIRIPQIFNVERDDEHVLINMEYVYSRNFIEFFEAAGFEQIDYFIKALILFLEKELKASPVQSVPTSITLDKFYDVESKVNANPLLSSDQEIQRLMALSRKQFEKFAKQPTVDLPMGICHGDLTFSNILFNGNNYYLIDFLDSFIESPLLDIVKIRQDSAHLWSQLMYTNPYDKLRLKIVCEKIDKEIDAYGERYQWYKEFYTIYQLLNLLRILQYAKEEKVITYLKEEIGRVLKEEEKVMVTTNENAKSKQKDQFSLIVPAAADTEDETLPYVFNLNEKGIMLCIDAILGLNTSSFDRIYYTVLRKHVERFYIDEMMKLQFKRLGLDNVSVVVLNEPTVSQTETLYQTIKKAKIEGAIFIKDADGYYKAEVTRTNGIALFPLEKMEIVNPRNKSYVSVDDMYYITNVIEKKVIGHYFNAGGSCFEDASLFCKYYEQLKAKSPKVYVSHIIYQMLLDRYQFRPIEVEQFKDWGNTSLYEYYLQQK